MDKPQRLQIEKTAKEIVLRVKSEGADPYEEIIGTGWGPSLLDTLLKKINIFSFIHDFKKTDPMGHNKDVGDPPLKLEVLREMLGGAKDQSEVKILKIESSPESMQQKNDAKSLSVDDIIPPQEDKQEKEASEFAPEFSTISTEDLKIAEQRLSDKIAMYTHQYRGMVMRISQEIRKSEKIAQELAKCHSESPATAHIFMSADKTPPEKSAKWFVISDEKLAEDIGKMDSLLEDIADFQGMHQTVKEEING